MGAAFLWRNKKLNAIGEEDEPDLVIVPDCAESEQTRDFCGQFPFRLRCASEVSRRADIHNQHYRKLTFFCKFFHKRVAHPRRDVPVDRANFISWLILPHVFKIHSPAFEDTVVIASERGLDEAACLYLERANFLKNLRWRSCMLIVPSGAKRSRGIPLHYLKLHLTAHISATRSRHSGFDLAISASFLLRRQRFNCFSRAMALRGSEKASKWIKLSVLYCRATGSLDSARNDRKNIRGPAIQQKFSQ